MTWGRADREHSRTDAGWPRPWEPERAASHADRVFRIAAALLRAGVSRPATEGLLASTDHDLLERQLVWLPYRKARDPAAFLLASIRGDYARPNGWPIGREARLPAFRQEAAALDSAPANPYLRPKSDEPESTILEVAGDADAPTESRPDARPAALDEDPEPPAGRADAGTLGHRAEDHAGAPALDGGVEPHRPEDDPLLRDLAPEDW